MIGSKIYQNICFSLAWLFLFIAWFSLFIAIGYFINAIQSYGIFSIEIFFDLGFVVYGLLSYGLISSAVIFASQGNLRKNQRQFRFFMITFFISTFFLIPLSLATILYLLDSIVKIN